MFDGILHNTSQEELYSSCVSDVVDQSIKGYNGTVLAYGQIGAGVLLMLRQCCCYWRCYRRQDVHHDRC